MIQEAVERINRSPTQLSFPPSDSTLDMFGVILQGFGNKDNGKNLFLFYLFPPLLRQPREGSMVCMCVCVCLDVCVRVQTPAPLHVNYV